MFKFPDPQIQTELIIGLKKWRWNGSYWETFKQTVKDNNERNAIPASFRSEGMIVYVFSTKEYYKLINGISNNDWQKFALLNIDASQNIIIDGNIVVTGNIVATTENTTITGDIIDTLGTTLEDIDAGFYL